MWFHGEGNFTALFITWYYVSFSDNCQIGLYCDTNTTTCNHQRAVGSSCSADKECNSFNCLPSRVCGVATSKPHHLATWVYLIIGVGIFGGKTGTTPDSQLAILHITHDDLGMIGTLFLLFRIHGRQRDDEREKRLQYWREQVKGSCLIS